jgi:hypothetical protein
MALIACPACSKEVSDAAVSCPSCGHPFRVVTPQVVVAPPATPKTSFATWGCLTIIVVMIIGVLLGKPDANESDKDTAADATAAPAGPPLAVTSIFLSDAYDRNEVAADIQFKGKVLAVSGTVKDISKDFTNSTYISLQGAGFRTVNVYLVDGQEGAAAALTKGQDIVLTGIGGGVIVGSPVVRDASM